MIKRGIKLGCTIFIITGIITGCSNSLKNENSILNNENSILNNEISVFKEKNAELQKSIDSLNEKLKELENSVVKGISSEHKNNMYPIYTANIETYKKEVETYIYLPKEAELNQKLSTIARVLSEVYFNNLPIEISDIEEVDNKKIVVVNLKELKENQDIKDPGKFKGDSWFNTYLQGSAGGTITSTRLIETMLQKEHDGEWIDGIKFLYDSEPIEFEHAPDMATINYRK